MVLVGMLLWSRVAAQATGLCNVLPAVCLLQIHLHTLHAKAMQLVPLIAAYRWINTLAKVNMMMIVTYRDSNCYSTLCSCSRLVMLYLVDMVNIWIHDWYHVAFIYQQVNVLLTVSSCMRVGYRRHIGKRYFAVIVSKFVQFRAHGCLSYSCYLLPTRYCLPATHIKHYRKDFIHSVLQSYLIC